MKLRQLTKLVRAICVLVFMAFSFPSGANAYVIDIEAYTDGSDDLILQGNTAQWLHLDFDAVGTWGGHNYPTYLRRGMDTGLA